MDIIDRSTVFTKTHHDGIIVCWIGTLTRENHALSSNIDLMEKSLILECIDNAIERREIHT